MTRHLFIYVLCDPQGDIRYVGKTEQGIKRGRQHGSATNMRKNAHLPVVKWIKSLRDKGQEYTIEIVEEHTDRQALIDAEMFYISYFRFLGFKLLNRTDGGEGFYGHHTDESKAKIGAYWSGRQRTDENKAKLSAARAGRPLSDEHRRALRTPHPTACGVPKSPETKAKIGAAMKARRAAEWRAMGIR